jgi:hypothetical protein
LGDIPESPMESTEVIFILIPYFKINRLRQFTYTVFLVQQHRLVLSTNHAKVKCIGARLKHAKASWVENY